jgi:hypothetical protein
MAARATLNRPMPDVFDVENSEPNSPVKRAARKGETSFAPSRSGSALQSGSISISDRAHELILRSTKQVPTRGLTLPQWQATLHHLHLANMGLDGDLELLRWAPNLQVLYVYDNMLESLSGLGSLRRLTHIYANNNDIAELGFEAPPSLEQLHLSNNCLFLVSGLEHAHNLSHLDLSSQRNGNGNLSQRIANGKAGVDVTYLAHPGDTEGGADQTAGAGVRIERESVWGIAPSLRSLNLSGNGIEDVGLSPFVVLQQLTELDLSCNALYSTNVLAQLLFRLPRLGTLRVRSNPLVEKTKWREALVIAGEGLREIDGKGVAAHERAFLLQLAAKRSGMSKPPSRGEAPGARREGGDSRAGSAGNRRPATVYGPYELRGPEAIVCDAPPLLLGPRRPLPTSAGAGRFRNGVQQ